MQALICTTCRHYESAPTNVFFHGSCRNPRVHRSITHSRSADVKLDIVDAREICNKEGDGIFVHFEPKTPASGATFDAECRSPHVSKRSTDHPEPYLAMRAAA